MRSPRGQLRVGHSLVVLYAAHCYFWTQLMHADFKFNYFCPKAYFSFTDLKKTNTLYTFMVQQGNLKRESVVAAILSSRKEVSYCTSGFFVAKPAK